MRVEEKLKALGIELPPVAKPVAAYVPAVEASKWVYISGQLPFRQGKLEKTAINGIAALKSIAGDLDNVERIVKVTGFVASAQGFNDQPKVVNGASELLGQVFGEAGKHARAAVGVAELPLNAVVEVELIALLK